MRREHKQVPIVLREGIVIWTHGGLVREVYITAATAKKLRDHGISIQVVDEEEMEDRKLNSHKVHQALKEFSKHNNMKHLMVENVPLPQKRNWTGNVGIENKPEDKG